MEKIILDVQEKDGEAQSTRLQAYAAKLSELALQHDENNEEEE